MSDIFEPHPSRSPSTPHTAPPSEQPNGVAKSPKPVTLADALGYCFTLRATISQTFIGEIPGGFRVDLQYDPTEALAFDRATALSTAEHDVLERAELLTGTDWVTVSSDGIATFDTRVTLRVGRGVREPDDHCVVSLNIRGRADLGDVRNERGTPLMKGRRRTDIIPAWQKGFEAKSFVPVAFSATFDVPTEGDSPEQDNIYRACRTLEQRFFVATGRATYLDGPNSPLDSIRLDFIRLDVPPYALEDDNDRAKRVGAPTGHIEGDSVPERTTT